MKKQSWLDFTAHYSSKTLDVINDVEVENKTGNYITVKFSMKLIK